MSFILHELCFKAYMHVDGTVRHCTGPSEHWGRCDEDWITLEERVQYGKDYEEMWDDRQVSADE